MFGDPVGTEMRLGVFNNNRYEQFTNLSFNTLEERGCDYANQWVPCG